MDKINAAIQAQAVYIYRAYRKYAQTLVTNRCKRNGPTILRRFRTSLLGTCNLAVTPYMGAIVLLIAGILFGGCALGLEFLFHTYFKQEVSV